MKTEIISSSELRIGSLIYAESKLVEVNFITPVSVGWGNGNFAPISSVLAFFKPIPLTQEWLINFGFEKREEVENANFVKFGLGENPITKDWIVLIKHFVDDNIFFYNNGFHTIKSVHQLQNLYFSLANKELTLTDDK